MGIQNGPKLSIKRQIVHLVQLFFTFTKQNLILSFLLFSLFPWWETSLLTLLGKVKIRDCTLLIFLQNRNTDSGGK